MRVLIAFDKFKDALTARQACEIAAGALRAKHPGWELDLCPLTDGGEGFTELLCEQFEGRIEWVDARRPRGGTLVAPVGFVSAANLPVAAQERLGVNGRIAVIGMAAASGLMLLPPAARNPWHTSTAGTGDLLRHAALRKADAILLGVGGSATNDLGLGALAVLGLRFLDGSNHPVEPVPSNWPQIDTIEGHVALPPVFIACDVTNPLLGPMGATATFGSQKGLPAPEIPDLDAQARRMAGMLCDHNGLAHALADTPGTGAAGGIGFGLMVACGAKLVPGFALVSDWLDLPARLAAADLVLTGEGRFDATSLAGKGPGSLVAEARQRGKAAHVFAGSLDVPASEIGNTRWSPISTSAAGVDRDIDAHPVSSVRFDAGGCFHAITPAGMPLVEALPRTAQLLAAAVERAL